MSGRKYSAVELAANVREAIRCRQAATEALHRAEHLGTALREASSVAPALQATTDVVESTLARVRTELDSMGSQFEERRMLQLDLQAVLDMRRRVDSLRAETEDAARRCGEGQAAVGVRATLVAVHQHLQLERAEMEPWLGQAHGAYLSETEDLLTKVEGQLRSDGALDAPTIAAVQYHVGRFDDLLARVTNNRSLDAERRYVSQALRDVCSRQLGFDVAELPAASPIEDVILDVNTFAYGVIRFRLQLDGTIRSESEMVEASCSSSFAAIEEQLKALGIQSRFRYEGDQRPVRIQRGTREQPDDGHTATSGVGEKQ